MYELRDQACAVLAGRSVLFVGDSTTAQQFISLVYTANWAEEGRRIERKLPRNMNKPPHTKIDICKGRSKVAYIPNTFLRDDCTTISLGRFDRCYPFWAHSSGYDVVVFNRGAHYVEDRQLAAEMEEFAKQLVARRPARQQIFWRDTVAGHEGCADAVGPGRGPPPSAASAKVYSWDQFEGQNSLVRTILSSTGIRYINANEMSLQRRDRHAGMKLDYGNGTVMMDCLHYCLPGPVDTWNLAMLAALAETPGLSASGAGASSVDSPGRGGAR